MPVLSAVLTISNQPAARTAVLDQLAATPGVTVGEIADDVRVPVVLDTDTRAADKALWTQVSTLPGVLHVELVFADFSDLDTGEPPPPRGRRNTPLLPPSPTSTP